MKKFELWDIVQSRLSGAMLQTTSLFSGFEQEPSITVIEMKKIFNAYRLVDLSNRRYVVKIREM